MGTTLRKDRQWWRVSLSQGGKRKCWLFGNRGAPPRRVKGFDYRLRIEGGGGGDRPISECFEPFAEQQLSVWGGGTLNCPRSTSGNTIFGGTSSRSLVL